jgi:hypothetical protein
MVQVRQGKPIKKEVNGGRRKADDGPVRLVHLFVGTSADDKRRTRP